MIDERLSAEDIRRQVQFHDTLNQDIWIGDRLRPNVRLRLLHAAIAFYRFLDVPKLVVRDIILTGSNAAYNYTDLSDIDVHLLVDFTHTPCPPLASNLFGTKKALWNQTFDVTIHDHPIEIYVEDINEPVTANGVYSILHGKWLRHPSKKPPRWDDSAVQLKAESIAQEIDWLLDTQPTVDAISQILHRLYVLRRSGLEHGGEFSVENLAYKALRSLGYIQRLYDKRIEIKDRELSL